VTSTITIGQGNQPTNNIEKRRSYEIPQLHFYNSVRASLPNYCAVGQRAEIRMTQGTTSGDVSMKNSMRETS